MRPRAEILAQLVDRSPRAIDERAMASKAAIRANHYNKAILEVLLDIRDLVMEARDD